MPLQRSVIPEKQVVVLVVTGDVTGEEIAREAWERVEAPPLPHPYRCLYDLREARYVGDLQAIKDLAAAIRQAEWPAGHRVAQVVGTQDAFGLARMFDMLADSGPIEYGLFHEMAEAWAWLGIAAPEGDG